MIKEYNSKSLAFGIPGLILQSIFLFLNPLISLIGSILLIIGLGYYAKGKGYPGYLGLLGLLSWLGIVILALLKDKHPGAADIERKKTEKRDALIFLGIIVAFVIGLILLWKFS